MFLYSVKFETAKPKVLSFYAGTLKQIIGDMFMFLVEYSTRIVSFPRGFGAQDRPIELVLVNYTSSQKSLLVSKKRKQHAQHNKLYVVRQQL